MTKPGILIRQGLERIAKPFLGRGIIDRYAHFLIPLYQRFYSLVQKNTVQTVTIPLDSLLFVFSRDVGVGLPLILNKSFEPMQTEAFLQMLKPSDIVFDIGANVGYYTILAAKKIGLHGRVIAFEPDQENTMLLHKNINLNKLQNVEVVAKAVMHKNQTVAFTKQALNTSESALAKEEKTASAVTVAGITIDSYVKTSNIHPTVVKMDIEGAEVHALNGGKQTFLDSVRLLFIEYNPSRLHHYGFTLDQFFATLASLHLNIDSIIDEQDKKVIPYSSAKLGEILTKTTYCTLICHPQPEADLASKVDKTKHIMLN